VLDIRWTTNPGGGQSLRPRGPPGSSWRGNSPPSPKEARLTALDRPAASGRPKLRPDTPPAQVAWADPVPSARTHASVM